MNDPLADLLAQMANAMDGCGDTDCEDCNLNVGEGWQSEAEWLRANRDRVLEALGLGGLIELLDLLRTAVKRGEMEAVLDFVADLAIEFDRLFPKGEDQ